VCSLRCHVPGGGKGGGVAGISKRLVYSGKCKAIPSDFRQIRAISLRKRAYRGVLVLGKKRLRYDTILVMWYTNKRRNLTFKAFTQPPFTYVHMLQRSYAGLLGDVFTGTIEENVEYVRGERATWD
jgi:hypothetical protein